MTRIVVALALVGWLFACKSDSGGTAPETLDVSGVWVATLDGTIINNEDDTGQTTAIELTLSQSGTTVVGKQKFQDTLGRSYLMSVSGRMSGGVLSLAGTDPDPQCDGRSIAGSGLVTAVVAGSTMSLTYASLATDYCLALDGKLTYTKQ